MWRMIRRRLLVLPILLVGVAFVVFLALYLVPGDPAEVIGGDRATPERIEQIREQYGLDQPMPVRFGRYLQRLAVGDLGESLFAHQPVAHELGKRMPASLELTFAALAIGVPAGVGLGIVGALHRNRAADNVATGVSLLGLAVPSFWLGLILAWVFGVILKWLPYSGRLPPFSRLEQPTGFVLVDTLIHGEFGLFWQGLRHLALPALTLSVIPAALVARFTRTAFIDALGQAHIRTARAYGIPSRRIVMSYAAKNAMLPLVTLFGALVPALLAGGVLVETVFSWPGIGTFLLNSITTRDYPVIQGTTLVFGVIYIVINLLVDVSYGLLDPRVRES